jgi:predicted ArsR family transcriptional regulator
MLNLEFLESLSDFYGSFSVDELAERLGVSTVELLEYLEDLLDESYDSLSEEMGYSEETDEEED